MEENRNYSKCSEKYLGMHEKRALIVNGPSKIIEMQSHAFYFWNAHKILVLSEAKWDEIIYEVAFRFSRSCISNLKVTYMKIVHNISSKHIFVKIQMKTQK